MLMKRLSTTSLIIAVLFICQNGISQSTLIHDGSAGATVPDASAILDVASTTKGMLIPRLTTNERTAITNAATGLLVFDMDTESFWFKKSTGWKELVDEDAAADDQTLSLSGSTLAIEDGNSVDLAQAGLPSADFDSGWLPVSANSNYDNMHNLGVLPRMAVVWAATDANGTNMYLMDGIFSSAGYGAWLQKITTTNYRISTGPNSAMSAYGVDHHWNWTNGTGYVRVLMWK